MTIEWPNLHPNRMIPSCIFRSARTSWNTSVRVSVCVFVRAKNPNHLYGLKINCWTTVTVIKIAQICFWHLVYCQNQRHQRECQQKQPLKQPQVETFNMIQNDFQRTWNYRQSGRLGPDRDDCILHPDIDSKAIYKFS